MKLSVQNSRIVLSIICQLYILLFVYAAVSKLLDFENFQVQLGQSPLLSSFAGSVAYVVPTLELIICGFLLSSRWRIIGLFAAYGLMVMFTAYIYIILNYSSFIPCSCGGILEDLSWNQHMFFNGVFIVLSVMAILLNNPEQNGKKYILLGIGGFFSIGLIATLFYMSENIMHHHNNFTRRFPHFPAVMDKEMDLQSDSYYFAGSDSGKIYLGNYTAPLQILEIDSTLKTKTIHRIKLDRMNLPFTAIQIKILAPYFYVVDGNVPCVFKGKISNWKASYVMRGDPYFSQFVPTDSSKIAFRTILKKTKTNTLGLFNLKDTTVIKFEPKLIQKQIDGVFDTDGQTLYDNQSKRLVYVYTYRNQFIVTDVNLKFQYRGNTIDTTAHAKLKVVTISSSGETKLAAPPLLVNKTSAVHNNLLFVASNLPGKYESLVMWKKASIIDLYNLDNRAYLLSFYIYDNDNKKMRSFCLEGNYLYALIGEKLISYKLRKSVTKNYQNEIIL
ncbi:Methylamine utilisation protein MauE [Flavobacterium omnivorum]|uniref:Methylamine utilisation protein MauE n=1 Tax=Flavobacterium omnivorum TaxID=178355 RepID=A0A1G8H6P7_9FLAO|nr:MauE/DoxX family redox-associated membrane protein [Flavobacterium omnivorum]SDI02296.1 Methylamine utilisation protein MauE [Flavobacterium omnivorum]